jgi:tripartite-type tricarboxylate transporter receptor subunit TctC
MKLPRRQFLRLAATAAALPAATHLAGAQGYPSRPVTIIVPFGPGAVSDTLARMIAQPLGIALKQSVVVETKPGANGTIAATQVARAAPDGYTLILGTNTPHSAAPSLVKNVSYDPVKDFAPLCRIGSFTQVLVLHPDVPAKTIRELIAYA